MRIFRSLARVWVQKNISVYIGLIVTTLFFGFPLYWMISSSFKVRLEWLISPPAYWPSLYTLGNYITVIKDYFSPYFFNSLIVASCSTVLALAIGSLAAYSLSRFSFRGSEKVAFWILSTRMLPPVAIVLPMFFFVQYLRLIDNYFPLIMIHTLFNVSLAVWLLKGFFDEIPQEIEEAAMVDGCNTVRVFSKIVIPLSAPGLVVTGVFCFIFSWNEMLMAFVLTRYRAATLPIQVVQLARGVFGTRWGPISGLTTISILPALVVVICLQRYLARGLTLGAVK